ncbi:MAG: ABC-2 transporter permease [Lysinibacillus sp.]
MNALILKDLMIIQPTLRKKAIIFSLLVLFVGFIQQGFLLLPLVALLAIFQVGATFFDDDLCNWDQYAHTLPVTRKDIVRSKYLLGILLLLVGLVVTTPLAYFINHFSDLVIFTNLFLTFSLSLTLGFCMLAFTLPINILFSFLSGKPLMPIFVFLLWLFPDFTEFDVGELLIKLIGWDEFLYFTPIFGLIILWLSYVVSLSFYKRKDL